MNKENEEMTVGLVESNETVGKGNITFTVGADVPTAVLELCANGDIYVHGRLAANDLEVVEALREFALKVKG